MRRTYLIVAAMMLASLAVGGVAWAANINGTSGPDRLQGTIDNDTIDGKLGNDVIEGMSGADRVLGGNEDDLLYGGREAGNNVGGGDEVRGQPGNDTIYGGYGADELYGGTENDVIYDALEDDDSVDYLYGENGDDELVAANWPARKDHVSCGTGTDKAVVDELDIVASDCETVNNLLSAEDSISVDAEHYAADYGVSVTEATRRLELQDDIGDLRAELEDSESSTFADLYISNGQNYEVVALFTQNGDQTVQPYIEGTPLEAIVETRPVDATLNELETVQEQAISTYESQGVPVESDINIEENQAEIYVTEEGQAQFTAAQQQSRQSQSLGSNVEVITVESLSTPMAYIYGGLALDPCTSGFTVRYNNDREGIVTAGHCEGTIRYKGEPLGSPPGADIDTQGSNDVRAVYTPFDDKAWFYDRDGHGNSLRGVERTRGRDYQSINQYVCKSGKTTGYTCGPLVGKHFRIESRDIQSPNRTFMRVDNRGDLIVDNGDSGGPVFNGGTALGLVSARSNGDLIYMASNYIRESSIGVGVSHVQKVD